VLEGEFNVCKSIKTACRLIVLCLHCISLSESDPECVSISTARSEDGSTDGDATSRTLELVQKPVHIAAVFGGEVKGVYTYTIPEAISFPPRTEECKWPTIRFDGSNGGAGFEKDMAKQTAAFRKALSDIQSIAGRSDIQLEGLAEYKLVIHNQHRQTAAKIWVGDALASIEEDPSMMKREEGSDVMELVDKVCDETGVSAQEYSSPPWLASYVVWVPQNMFVCFIMYDGYLMRQSG
jgi:hypothetical protein